MEQAEIKELVELFSEFLQKKKEAKTYAVQLQSHELKSVIAARIHAMTIADLVDTSQIRWGIKDGVLKMEDTNWLKIEVIVKSVLDELDKFYNLKPKSSADVSPDKNEDEKEELFTAGDAFMTDVPETEPTFTAGDAYNVPEPNPQFFPYDTLETTSSSYHKPKEDEQTFQAGDSIGNWQ